MDEREIERLFAEVDDAVTPPDEDELRAMARRAAGPRPIAARGRPLRLRWVAAVAGALLLGSGFGFGLSTWNTPEGSAGTRVAGVGFLPAKGWTVVQSEALGPTTARAVAANVPLHPADDLASPPTHTLGSLAREGIVIFATFTLRGDPQQDVWFPVRSLPLRIAAAEALPIAPAAEYRLRAGVEAQNVDVRIYFGSPRPSAALLGVAQRQLNRLVVASERITLLARPLVIADGKRLTLYGSIDSIKADEEVTIEVKECGKESFMRVAAILTHGGGGWSTDAVDPFITATIRASWRGAVSAPVLVRSRARVQLRTMPGSSTRFEVAVVGRAQFWRKHALFQRLDRRLGTWKTVKRVVLTETGGFGGSAMLRTWGRFTASVPKGSIVRAVLPLSQAKPCYLEGYSRLVRP